MKALHSSGTSGSSISPVLGDGEDDVSGVGVGVGAAVVTAVGAGVVFALGVAVGLLVAALVWLPGVVASAVSSGSSISGASMSPVVSVAPGAAVSSEASFSGGRVG